MLTIFQTLTNIRAPRYEEYGIGPSVVLDLKESTRECIVSILHGIRITFFSVGLVSRMSDDGFGLTGTGDYESETTSKVPIVQ